MNTGDLDEGWEEYSSSGCIPMILAGYRMSAARRTFPELEKLTDSIAREVEAEAAGFLAWSKAHENYVSSDHPGFLIDMAAAQDVADEMHAATFELGGLFFGSLIVYLLSTLEATLAACVEVAQIVTHRPVTKRVRNPKLENCAGLLGDCGVCLGWDAKMWTDLRTWRDVRNKLVHTLEMFDGVPGPSSEAAQEVFWLVDAAIRKLDDGMSAALKRHTERPHG